MILSRMFPLGLKLDISLDISSVEYLAIVFCPEGMYNSFCTPTPISCPLASNNFGAMSTLIGFRLFLLASNFCNRACSLCFFS